MRPALAVLLLGLPLAAQAADPAEGRKLAEQWCANCHLVAPGVGAASDAVPAFRDIAGRPGRTEAGIATFLRTPHATMPDHGLTLRQGQDLAAYVMSQGAR